MKKSIKNLSIFAYITLFIILILVCRYAYIQIIKADYYQDWAVEQRVKKIENPPERGIIEDKNGNTMAMNITAQDVNIYPNMINSEEHKEKVIKLLSETLSIKREVIEKKVNAESYWEVIAKNVDKEKVKKIKEANIGGIKITEEPKRYYPNGKIGASILGFTNAENQPGSGLELSMNKYLAGVKGYTMAEVDSEGRTIPIGRENNSSPVNGQKVTLTIDSYMQYVLDRRLEQAQEEMNPKSIHAIVMNPNTGNILAMASTPTYDPNKYDKYEPSTWTVNPTSFVYEPGSTFKPIYMAQALELGKIDKDTTISDPNGCTNVQGVSLCNWDKRGIGEATLSDIIINSSNVGMIGISKKLTTNEIVKSLKSRGFGQRTGIQLAGEEMGILRSEEYIESDPLMKATMSYGQGISVTPIQLITAFSEIINGGKDLSANLVSKVEDENGNVLYERTGLTGEQAYKKEVSQLMKGYLNDNSNVGSGKDYQVEGYKSGTKTGSAWVVSNGSSAYEDGAIIGSFMGFIPYENPEYVMLVIVDRPEGIEFGGPAAGPIFKDVMEEYLRYQNVEKEGEKENEEKKVELKVTKVENMYVEDAENLLMKEQENVEVKRKGNGKVVVKQTYTYKNGKLVVTLQTKKINDKEFTYIPNIINKTQKEVKEIFENEGIDIEFHGTGKVVEISAEIGRNEKIKELKIWTK